MNLNFRNRVILSLVAVLTGMLSSCGHTPALVSPTSTLSQPTNAEPAVVSNESSLLKAGFSYSDASGDMNISFLDVVAFQAAVDEETETLEVILKMRDIPETALRGQVKNLFEYSWTIFIYLDPSRANPEDIPGDYYFGVNTSIDEPFAAGGLTPVPGTPVTVPINQLLEVKITYNSAGMSVSAPQAVADPASDTLVISGRVPKIKSNALFSFVTSYYDDTTDRPDNFISTGSAHLSTPLPETIQATQTESAVSARDAQAQLRPAGAVRAYPGPVHYAGDVLTFEITTDGSFGEEPLSVSMSLDDRTPTEVSAAPAFLNLVLPLALDTMNLSGRHTVKFRTADGRLNESYSFEVLPAEQRPANETRASWQVNEIDCCTLYYISETAAARDIEFIAEHFQQAARDFATITGEMIDPKLNVYIIDTMWGNGGFGGNGELVISYTDRYYGPTVGGIGLEILARHEFTHASNIDLVATGDGVDFNYEGLAVYVAGGHYKPEPLAERGAALFDLGYYVPVGQFFSQHELGYLYPAAMLTYIVETYGQEKMWQFLGYYDNLEDDQPGSLEGALQAVLGVSVNDFDQGFQTWLESKDPGQQLEDLRLTIELQDLRREYQERYAPAPYFLLAEATSAAARPDYLPVVIREARAPANVAIELIFANAQRAIAAGAYSEAQELIKVISDVVSTGQFENPLAKEYLDIAGTAADAGYEVLILNLQNGYATAQATNEPPITTVLNLQKIDGVWRITP
jgi:hypothetical protein